MQKVKELTFGQFFQCEDIIARLLGGFVVFFNSKLILHNQISCCDSYENWKEENVTPIDLQTAVLLLVKECLITNDAVPEIDYTKVDATTLKPGQFLLHERVGLVFNNESVCYLHEDGWDDLKDLHQVVPLTMHQAVLLVAQDLVGKTATIPRIKLFPPPITFNKNSWYIKYKEAEYQEVYEQYYLQHAGKYWK
ncbi:MAG: hypothetical protein M0R80_25650 [Proteobacteria bacterium]|jgi:hypothetical protein|nr:hypothetical protein [Pseudomonadota bacterium]